MNLEFIRPFIKYVPEIKLPKRHVPFKEKLMWTLSVLALFFLMGTIYPVKVSFEDLGKLGASYQQFQIVFASNLATLTSVGIGPIVTSSIVLQLLVGSKMIEIDLTKSEGKALFQGTQKILTVFIALFEAAAVVIGLRLGSTYLGAAWSPLDPIVLGAIFQIALGSIMLMYMDEIVSKWGIGSGIGLFIAGGVSLHIISGSINFLYFIDADKWPSGIGYIPDFFRQLLAGGNSDILSILLILFPIVATVIVFLVTVFAESMRLEIPLSYGGVRGVGGRYPLKFFYVSNIPVILTAALLANVQMLPGIVGVSPSTPLSEMNPIQHVVTDFVGYVTLNGYRSTHTNLHGILDPRNINQLFHFDAVLHLIIYGIVFLSMCILFGKFWVETTGLGSEQVAEQIQRGGMQIPGFRRDKRVIERVLNRYIPQITIISSIAVGLVAFGADLLGAMGSGTGILLTVGILYRLYEEMQKEQMADMHPAFRRMMGKE